MTNAMLQRNLQVFCIVVIFEAALAGADSSNNKPVTFAQDIAPIFQAKCEECHRVGSMAPMSLVTYQETRPWVKAIQIGRAHV